MEIETKNTIIVAAFLVIGLFFPTSLGGVIQSAFVPLASIVGVVFMILFFKLRLSGNNILIVFLVNFCLIAFTFTSEFSEKSLGIYPNFLFLSMFFLIDIKQISLKKQIRTIFVIATYSIIILGVGVIFRITPITDFILAFYSASYDDLVPRMILFLKPVATFGTHSVSGLFIFLFFYLNFLSFQVFTKKIYLINAIILLLLLVFIRSNTAYFYLLISLLIILPSIKKINTRVIAIIAISLIVVIVLIVQIVDFSSLEQTFNVMKTLSSKSNGLAGRYSQDSPVFSTINYILKNPFSPIGLSYSKNLYYTDAGYILYLLRGSIVLLFMIYLGFVRAIYFNIINKKECYILLFVLLIFEVGYPILINFRMIFFLPFLIVYLNFLEKSKPFDES